MQTRYKRHYRYIDTVRKTHPHATCIETIVGQGRPHEFRVYSWDLIPERGSELASERTYRLAWKSAAEKIERKTHDHV